jgi:lysozyme
MQTSPEGRAYIERKEGLRLHAYQDIAGVWTIGYGHTGPEVGPGVVWTKEQCDDALSDDWPMSLSQQLARCAEMSLRRRANSMPWFSLAYNIGVAGFERSEVAKLHRQHAYDRAADAFEHWDHVNGRVNEALHQRRVEEGQMYMDASPARAPAADDEPSYPAGTILTPMGSDPIGQQKSVAVGATTTLAVPLHWWTRTRYGIEMPVEVAMSLLGFIGTMLVWLVPHGRK